MKKSILNLVLVMGLGMAMFSCSTPDAPEVETTPSFVYHPDQVVTTETINPNEMILGITIYEKKATVSPVTYSNRLVLRIDASSLIVDFKTLQNSQYAAVNIVNYAYKMQKEVITYTLSDASTRVTTIKKYFLRSETLDYIKITETYYFMEIEYYKEGSLKYKGFTEKVLGN